MNLECSSKGDKRFSAMYAKVEVFGVLDTIENHYQACKRFNGEALPPREAKGRHVTSIVLKGIELEPRFLTPFYKLMWAKYLNNNPELVEYAAGFDTFTDMFRGNSINCQADVIQQYVREGRESLLEDCKELMKLLNSETIVIALTGHRPKKLGGYDYYSPKNLAIAVKLREHLLSHLNKGKKVHAISGMAVGGDTIYALVALKLRDQGYPITLEAAIPCANHFGTWPPKAQQQWHDIVSRADKVTYVSNEPYQGYLMQKRNEYMVDQCSELIAVWDGTSGGTHNCLLYAWKQPVNIVQINPTELLIVEKGDLLKSNCDVIFHQANCLSIMRAGIANQIRVKYPAAYAADRNSPLSPEEKLGKYTYVRTDGKEVVNLYGQYEIGRDKKQTDYDALKNALFSYLTDKQVQEDLSTLKLGVPYLMGCGLAGGDWNVVKAILEEACNKFNISIYAYQI